MKMVFCRCFDRRPFISNLLLLTRWVIKGSVKSFVKIDGIFNCGTYLIQALGRISKISFLSNQWFFFFATLKQKFYKSTKAKKISVLTKSCTICYWHGLMSATAVMALENDKLFFSYLQVDPVIHFRFVVLSINMHMSYFTTFTC